MPTPTYTPLANVTTATTVATVTFSSITQGYRDLVLISNIPVDTNSTTYGIRVNSDGGNNYSRIYALGNGSSTDTFASTSSLIPMNYSPSTSGDKIMAVSNFMDYSATDKHKTVLTRASNPARETSMSAARWANTAAITTILVSEFNNTGILPAGATFALYGIAS